MGVKYKCPNCLADMLQNCEVETADGNRVVEPRYKIFHCTNPSYGYTCNESTLKQIGDAERTGK